MPRRVRTHDETEPKSSNGSQTGTLDRLLSPEQVARQLGVARSTVLEWARVGVSRGGAVVKLQPVRFGRTLRFDPDAVLAFGHALGQLDGSPNPRSSGTSHRRPRTTAHRHAS